MKKCPLCHCTCDHKAPPPPPPPPPTRCQVVSENYRASSIHPWQREYHKQPGLSSMRPPPPPPPPNPPKLKVIMDFPPLFRRHGWCADCGSTTLSTGFLGPLKCISEFCGKVQL